MAKKPHSRGSSRPRQTARRPGEEAGAPPPSPAGQDKSEATTPLADHFSKMFAPPELYDPKKREAWRLVSQRDQRGPYVIELNLQHIGGLEGASAALRACASPPQFDSTSPVPVTAAPLRNARRDRWACWWFMI